MIGARQQSFQRRESPFTALLPPRPEQARHEQREPLFIGVGMEGAA